MLCRIRGTKHLVENAGTDYWISDKFCYYDLFEIIQFCIYTGGKFIVKAVPFNNQGPIKAATSTWKSVTYIKKPINSKAVKPEATIGSAHDTRDV